MTPEFTMKLGILLGSLDSYISLVDLGEATNADSDRIRELVKDVKKKFFAQVAKEES